MTKKRNDKPLFCSFCAKSSKDKSVGCIVAGPDVNICEACINLCNEMIAERSPRVTIEKDYCDKLVEILRGKNLRRIRAIKQTIDVFLLVQK